MPDDIELASPAERRSRSKMRRALAAVFIAALTGIIFLTVRLPHALSHKPPTLALLWSALGMFSLALIIGAIFLWFVIDRFKESAAEFNRVQGILRSTGANTERPAWLSQRLHVSVVALLIGVPVLALLIFIIIRQFIPKAPSWTPVAVIWVAGGILVVLMHRRAGQRTQSGAPRPALWRTLVNFGLWFGLFILATRFDPRWLSPYISPKTFLVLLLLFCLALPFIVWASGFLPFWWIARAFSRADYATALRRADFLLRIKPGDAGFRFLRGTVLLMAGRYPEAEETLRQSAEAGDASAASSQSVTLTNMGEVIMLQGRYEEAIQKYEAAVEIHPGWGWAYAGTAEAFLRRDMEPERALLLIDRGIERKLRSWVSRTFDRHILGQMHADRAWALALLGRTAECREEIEKALRVANRRSRPGLAGVHYRAGRALLALHDGQADEHFRRAQELDPGSNGMQAAEMLNRDQ